jgi:hypothetical protein
MWISEAWGKVIKGKVKIFTLNPIFFSFFFGNTEKGGIIERGSLVV